MWIRRIVAGIALGSLLGVSVACAPPNTPSAAATDIAVNVRTAHISAADTVAPGWRRLTVDEVEGEHIVVVFRLPAETDPATFLTALDSAPATPPPAVAIGGPEVGARGEVVVHLEPGDYLLACVRRGDDGHRHALAGESRRLHVRAATATDSVFAAPPPSAQTLQLADFAYVGPDHWAPGAQWLRIENTGKQDHQLRLARMRDGATLATWMSASDPDSVATTVVGMARVGPGQVAYLPLDLTPGAYVVYCLVADAASKRPHVELGMLRAIQVP